MLKEKEVIEFSNKEYAVISSMSVDKINYAYIMNIENYNEVLFIKNKKDEVEVINEKEKLNYLIKKFNQKINNQKLSEI